MLLRPLLPLTTDQSPWPSAALEPQTSGDDREEAREPASPRQPPEQLTTPASNASRWDTTPETAPSDDSAPARTSSTSTRKPSTKKRQSIREKPPHKARSM